MLILNFLLGALKIIAILGTLITIHELGHFTVAKLCNVQINKFSIGFGPILFEKVSGETQYTLRLIPFGGFVQMEGEEERSDNPRSFNNKKIWQRIAIIFAGPIVNIVFALLVYFCMATVNNTYYSTIVTPINEGPIYEAGVMSGDRIVKVNGKKTLMLGDVERLIEKSESDDMIFTIERSGEIIDIPITIPYIEKGYLGVAFSESGEIVYLMPNAPAYEMSLLPGDLVVAVNGVSYSNVSDIVGSIREIKDETISLDIIRNGKSQTVTGVTKTVTERSYYLDSLIVKPDNIFEGCSYAWNTTKFYWVANLEGLAEIFTGKTENVEVMGPVGIAEKISETNEWYDFFYLMSAISLSLGIFNLVPIPALDGGRILILIVEGIRRKPMKEEIEQGLILAGFALIILFAIIVTISDVIKIF